MWRSWLKSSPKNSDFNNKTSSSSSPKQQQQQLYYYYNNNNNNNSNKEKDQSSIFRCSSFKDIENLCNIDLDFSNSISTPPNSTNSLKRHRSVFHRVRTVNSLLRQWPGRSDPPKLLHSSPSPGPTPDREETCTPKPSPSPEARIVVYYTSLRVVRPTFEACRAVMSILQGFRLQIDERDLAMDLGFLSELRELLGLKLTEELTLPRVFIGGRYIGGAEEVKHLHEIGELTKLVSGIPPKKNGTCDTCGGYRFILCAQCSGSHKIFSEKIGFRCCLACNENGLIRCPRCSSPPLIRPILAPINNGC